MCALAAKQAVAVPNESAATIATIRVFIMPAIPAECVLAVNTNSATNPTRRTVPE
jgi:hypothetical protein